MLIRLKQKTPHSCNADCGSKEGQLCLLTLDMLLEDKAGGETTNHVAKEPECPDQVDGGNVNPSVPKRQM